MSLMRDKKKLLADFTREERIKRNWTQADLADRMGKVRAVINKIESGSNEATLETLALLSKAFGYPLSVVLDFLGYDVNMQHKDKLTEGMSHKLDLLSPAARKMVNKVIDSFLEENSDDTKK